MDPPIKIAPYAVLDVLRVSNAPPKELLEIALNRVKKNSRDAVIHVLYEAKVEKLMGEREGRWIDFARTYEEHRKPASTALKKFRRYQTTISAPNVPVPGWLDEAIHALDKFELPARRRAKEGRHCQLWIDKARGKLKELGIPIKLSEELLLACGIRRPRSRNDD